MTATQYIYGKNRLQLSTEPLSNIKFEADVSASRSTRNAFR